MSITTLDLHKKALINILNKTHLCKKKIYVLLYVHVPMVNKYLLNIKKKDM